MVVSSNALKCWDPWFNSHNICMEFVLRPDAGFLKASPMELVVVFGADQHQICIQSASNYFGCGLYADSVQILSFPMTSMG